MPKPEQRHALRREITIILCCKLLALIALRLLFFDQRPQMTPATVEQHVLVAGEPARQLR